MPELQVSDITLDGKAAALGKFGFLEVQVNVDQLTVDDDVTFSVNLQGPPKLRLTDLGASLGALSGRGFDWQRDGQRRGPSGKCRGAAHLPGPRCPVRPGQRRSTLTWANIADPTGVAVDYSLGSDLVNFLKVGAQQVRDQVGLLKTNLNLALEAGPFKAEVPVVGKALDGILNLVNAFDAKVIQPLTSIGGSASFDSVQDLAYKFAQSMASTPPTWAWGTTRRPAN